MRAVMLLLALAHVAVASAQVLPRSNAWTGTFKVGTDRASVTFEVESDSEIQMVMDTGRHSFLDAELLGCSLTFSLDFGGAQHPCHLTIGSKGQLSGKCGSKLTLTMVPPKSGPRPTCEAEPEVEEPPEPEEPEPEVPPAEEGDDEGGQNKN